MVALRGKEIDAFLARPDSGRPIILLYGPDAGLVRERAEALLASAVDDPGDPFSLVRLDGDELSAEPSRLVDEALKRRPALKTLFTSGYTENAIVHHGRLDTGVLLLAKPYRKSDLAHMIRLALTSLR